MCFTHLAIRCSVRVFVVALGRFVRCVRHPCGARHMHLRSSVAGVRPPLVGRSPPKEYRQAHLQRTCARHRWIWYALWDPKVADTTPHSPRNGYSNTPCARPSVNVRCT